MTPDRKYEVILSIDIENNVGEGHMTADLLDAGDTSVDVITARLALIDALAESLKRLMEVSEEALAKMLGE